MKWIAAAVIAAIAYIAYPYVALWQLDRAIQVRDVLTLESVIDWPQVRASLKADVRAAYAAKVVGDFMADPSSTGVGAAGTAVGVVLGGTLIDNMIDGFATPQVLVKVIADAPLLRDHQLIDLVSYAFFVSPTTFRLDLKRPNEEDVSKITLLMSLSGISWKVTRLVLPAEFSREPEVDRAMARWREEAERLKRR